MLSKSYAMHYFLDKQILITKDVFWSAVDGDLRQYLDGLATAENMKKYVEQHPFGQEHITQTSESWNFYLNAFLSLACQPKKRKYGFFQL